MPVFTIAVEGRADVPIVRKILEHVGYEVGVVHGQAGKATIDRNLRGYNNAARYAPWLVVRDLNGDAPCAPELVHRLLPQPAPRMHFRIAVRVAEAWLLADDEQIKRFLRVNRALVPQYPETLPMPKRTLIDLARRSRIRSIREDMVPRPGSSATVGPAYVSRVGEFAREFWRPDVALDRSDSLRRCIERLRQWTP